MKNTMNINLGNINLVIEGQPVVLENINFEYTNECSVQELAAGASFIKDLIGEIKSTIKEAQASAIKPEQSQVVAPAPQIYSDNFCEVTKEKVEHRTDINKVFECLEKVLPQHEGWTSDGYGNISFKKDDAKASIALQKNKIEMHICPETGSNLHIYLYKNRVNLDGVAPAFCEKWFNNHKKEFPGIENIFNVIQPFVENNAE